MNRSGVSFQLASFAHSQFLTFLEPAHFGKLEAHPTTLSAGSEGAGVAKLMGNQNNGVDAI
jgi:hypothetical protein